MVPWVKRHPLAYVAVTVPLLLCAWEWFARQFVVPEPVPSPLAAVTLPLYEPTDEPTTRRTPRPRVLILGNSQIHYVRDQEDVQRYGFPAQLQTALTAQGTPQDVADLSAGGQQVVESLAILIDAIDRVRPDHVLLGLGLANMRGVTIPPQLVNSLDWDHVRTVARQHQDPRTSAELATTLLQLYHPSEPQVVAHDPTIQEQLDEQIAEWLTDHAAAVRNRAVMSDWVAKLPSNVERDIRQLWRKKARGQFKARTYDAGPNYDLSLAAVRIMAAVCREKRIPFTVIAMPFHPACEPVLYVPGDEQRLITDLRQLEADGTLRCLDLRLLLGSEHFGTFPDGSPDGLHFLATGHAVLGRAVADYFSRSPSPDSDPPRLRVVNFEEDTPASGRSVQ